MRRNLISGLVDFYTVYFGALAVILTVLYRQSLPLLSFVFNPEILCKKQTEIGITPNPTLGGSSRFEHSFSPQKMKKTFYPINNSVRAVQSFNLHKKQKKKHSAKWEAYL